MEGIVEKAIQAVQTNDLSFAKYITANDTGATGAHQAGFHISKKASPLFFEKPGVKGANLDKFITIKWQDDFETPSRAIYYGVGTRNEYRLTRFGKGFPFLSENNVGDLLVITKVQDDYYLAFVLSSDNDIDEFLAFFGLTPTSIGELINKNPILSPDDILSICFQQYIQSVASDFPSTFDLATQARTCFINAYRTAPLQIISKPDESLLNWIDTEYKLFKAFENSRYSSRITSPFSSVEELIEVANTILNRRKSRAGKSLEHHLSEIFNRFELSFSTQAVTEGNKKPDFLFPSAEAYHNPRFDDSKLILLAAKTTCKDRWRQILNEADKIRTKHLFTLQQGISKNQLDEMYKSDVCLVVPNQFLNFFPKDYRNRILTLESFVSTVRSKQA